MRFSVFALILIFVVCLDAKSGFDESGASFSLENPVDPDYLGHSLTNGPPRLVYTSERLERVRRAAREDTVVANQYATIRLQAEALREQSPVEREQIGRRILKVSREFLRRVNLLGAVYLIDGEAWALRRLEEEVQAVCAFADWNPTHFLDTAEMALGVALAIDWAHAGLSRSTVSKAKNALVEKALKPSFALNDDNSRLLVGTNNWNQVCNGGLIAAALAVAEKEPDLAARVIGRALDVLPNALRQYRPDGVYPEGPSYWVYGTAYSVITIAILQSALGTDFGYAETPGFQESAVFRKLSAAPSDLYFNFGDSHDTRSPNGDVILAWFATKTGNAAFFERERFLRAPEDARKLFRMAGASLAWIADFTAETDLSPPSIWSGRGANPIVIVTGGNADHRGYYAAAKGGRGRMSHGNLDAGSFIFETDGVRWALDPGNQDYHALESIRFNQWSTHQESDRWTLLTKNNFGHNTLTVDGSLHRASGQATLERFEKDAQPTAVFDLSALFEENVRSAERRFFFEPLRYALTIEDEVVLSRNTTAITWQLLTTAKVQPMRGGAVLRQDGREMNLEVLSHPELQVSLVSLDPPPLAIDRQISGFKRIELHFPAWAIEGDRLHLRVRLTSLSTNTE
jgi:hypothetical protein